MIQELLGGTSAPTGFLDERKISIPFSSTSTTCPTSTPILTTTSIIATNPSSTNLVNSSNSPSGTPTTANNSNNNSSETNTNQQILRCPRCDSTNTKFCYYNNYNLTQPRHFCKTCRRYWTKGGTLRNVPIGGGCRKNKTTTSGSSVTSGLVKSSSNAMAKAKASLSTELLVNGNPGFLGSGLLDHLHHPELQSNPILWPTIPQNSHILSLLRGSNHQFHNPNPNQIPNVFSPVKAETNTTTTTTTTTTALGLDSYGNGAPSNLLGSFSRTNQHQVNDYSSGGPDFGPNNGNNSNILELYQRLKSSSNYGYNEGQGAVVLGNMVGSTTPSSMHSTILDSGPVGGGDHHYGGYGFMNSPAIISGWSEFPTVPINNGAFP